MDDAPDCPGYVAWGIVQLQIIEAKSNDDQVNVLDKKSSCLKINRQSLPEAMIVP